MAIQVKVFKTLTELIGDHEAFVFETPSELYNWILDVSLISAGDVISCAGVFGLVKKGHYGYYLYYQCGDNNVFFDAIGVSDPKHYCELIVGYRPQKGCFPELKTLNDLKKVIDAMNADFSKYASGDDETWID